MRSTKDRWYFYWRWSADREWGYISPKLGFTLTRYSIELHLLVGDLYIAWD